MTDRLKTTGTNKHSVQWNSKELSRWSRIQFKSFKFDALAYKKTNKQTKKSF